MTRAEIARNWVTTAQHIRSLLLGMASLEHTSSYVLGTDDTALLVRLSALGDEVCRLGGCPAARPAPESELATFFRLVRAPVPRVEHRVLESPWLVVVLAGSLTLSSGDTAVRAGAGEVLTLPERTGLHLTLTPADDSEFRALEVELLAEALVRLTPALGPPGLSGAGLPTSCRAGRPALTALLGFCESVLEPSTHPLLLVHQLQGVILALSLESSSDRAALYRARAHLDVTLAIRQLVGANPDRPWGLPGIARRLGLSQATLRRRLARRGTGLRRLVQEERMRVGRALLGDGRLNVTEVALRCGYGSPAKFSRQFKQSFGVVPSQYRQVPPH